MLRELTVVGALATLMPSAEATFPGANGRDERDRRAGRAPDVAFVQRGPVAS